MPLPAPIGKKSFSKSQKNTTIRLTKTSDIYYTEMKEYTILSTLEYDEWLEEQSAKSQVQVRDRISHIQDEGHFGDHRDVEDHVWELKWRNGRRVYYSLIPEKKILLLLGGNKKGQGKDIRQAKKIFRENVTFKK